ncbi:hypothetical protein Calkr_0662 [Caldicellulosiruptor acetigenus I77R1B]|uniref:Uncharacterized protein n=2 Tax=Caldicellulosiruptor acetigenus TaxID=301953 RepID=G2PTJ7_9FIRM|nr:hypothetical protein [Caldicellulosiruptor acetigenus]ADQ40201.1 hypothetical protein Calkr_0662 [Caldicellulosiruptor acetigenus I77R1B]AEM74278.1 hypothetical protein Calla_1684 [Caldicellulosiruptor acetigenus 6A]
MSKVTVNIPKPVYDRLCELAVEGRTIDEIITHAIGILIDTVRRATERKLETAHWFTIASAIDMDYRKLLILFLDQGTDLFSSLFAKYHRENNTREIAQVLRVIIFLEYLKEGIHNEGIDNLVELRYSPLEEELKFWQNKGFTIPKNLLLKFKSESEATYQ